MSHSGKGDDSIRVEDDLTIIEIRFQINEF